MHPIKRQESDYKPLRCAGEDIEAVLCNSQPSCATRFLGRMLKDT
jgi:hypothetical protein